MSTIDEALKKAQEQKKQIPQERIISVVSKEDTIQKNQIKKSENIKRVRRPAKKVSPWGYLAAALITVGIFVLLGIYFKNNSIKQINEAPIPSATKIFVPSSQKSAAQENKANALNKAADVPEKPKEAPAAKAQPPRFLLNGIIYDEKNPMAIVNNQIVIEGQIVDNATVMKILADRVTLYYDGQEIQLETPR